MMAKKIFLVFVLATLIVLLFAAVGQKVGLKHIAPTNEKELPAAAGEYRRIMERFSGADSNIDLSGTIRIYDSENKYALKEQRGFRYTRYGSQFYTRLSCLQTFCDGSLMLQLDTLNRTITVSKATVGQKGSANPVIQSFDRLFSDTATFRISGKVSELASERILKMQSDFNPEIRSCSLIYDTLSYRLHRAEVEWWKQIPTGDKNSTGKIWLAKLDYHYQSPVPFDMHKRIDSIILIKDGHVYNRPAYKDYQVNTSF